MKVRKILLDKKTTNNTGKRKKVKVTVFNALKWFLISKLFSLEKISKASLGIIERWFTTVADSKDFLELDFTLVATVLNSSELLVDSELQVFDVMNAWLNHKQIERSKHAKYLLQRVRLSLLSVPALNNILDKNLWITENDECSEVVKKVIEYKNKFPFSCTNILPTSRYCSQKNFKFIINDGRRRVAINPIAIDLIDFSSINSLPITNYRRYRSKIVCIKGEIYVFGGSNGFYPVLPVEKYSPDTNTWDVITKIYDGRKNFCGCSFIDSIFVLGGLLVKEKDTNSCLVFNTINKKWKQISKMKVARKYASCTVFEGRIVVSGGHNWSNGKLKTVEAYDHVDDSWTNMPSMIEERRYHKSVAIKNKLYIVGTYLSSNLEVFDFCSNKFALIKYNSTSLRNNYIFDISTFGNKILFFIDNSASVLVYDVESDEWLKKLCEATQHIEFFSCAKIPQL